MVILYAQHTELQGWLTVAMRTRAEAPEIEVEEKYLGTEAFRHTLRKTCGRDSEIATGMVDVYFSKLS